MRLHHFPGRGKSPPRPDRRFVARLVGDRWAAVDRATRVVTECESRELAVEYAAALNVVAASMGA